MRFHTLAGLPRSGSTLLANVLSQHPDVSVSGTSALAVTVEAVANVLSTADEVKSDLANVKGSQDRYSGMFRALIESWCSWADTDVVIDKGRGWSIHRALLDVVVPDAVSVVTVRDPRDVVASVERRHRETATFNSPYARSLYDAADVMLSPDGLVGGPLRFCEDLIRRNFASVEWVRYETFVRDPLSTMLRIEERLGLGRPDGFAWEFEHVESTASDLDALYHNKFPHDGSGPIRPTGSDWHDVIPDDLAALIAGVAPLYMTTFGYEEMR